MKDFNSVIEIAEIWPVSTEAVSNGGIGISWVGKGVGFGEYILRWGDDGKLHADTEHMDSNDSKWFTAAILMALANEVVIDE